MVSKTTIENILHYLHNHVKTINDSKLFAGLMIITLNIASKFVTMKFSKTMEAYLKFTFSRDVLIFAIAWMGTRDIYIATIVTIVFIICMDFLFHEESPFCCFSEQFKDYHISLLNENEGENSEEVTDADIKAIQKILEKVKNAKKKECPGTKQIQNSTYSMFTSP